MFHLTLSPNITKIFDGFCILKRFDDIKCLYSYPSNYSFKKFYEFIFPCNCPKEKSEEYCIVTSNASNDRSFLLCRYSDVYQTYLCIYSENPWFEIFSKLLFNLSHSDFMPDKYNQIGLYLQKIYAAIDESCITLPPCKANDNISQRIMKSSMKYPFIYDKYIQEYLTAIKSTSGYNKQLWLEVFWSMLLERPIIFMSKRYQKLTSSLLAATFFIHPLSWLHKFVSIIPQKNPQLLGMNCCMLGIHSCMEPILEKADFWNEALLVDLDRGDSKMVGACEDKKETESRFKVPKYIKNFFINHIQMVDESVSSNSPQKIKDLISNTPWDINAEEIMFNEYKKGFHLYPLLFRTIIAMIIGNYRQFISLKTDGYEFEKEQFIQFNPKLTEFLKIFVQSQCFDSFIEVKLKCFQDGNDMNDRFDRERLELPSKIKTSNPKVKGRKLSWIKSKTGFHLKNEKPINRLEKTSTMPNLQKPNKKEYVKKTNFYAKSLSLSSSNSSINGNNTASTENFPDTMSNNSDSLLDQVVKGLDERRIKRDSKNHCHLSNISTSTVREQDDILLTPMYEKNKTFDTKINNSLPPKFQNEIPHTKPLRPLFKPGEAPAGRVTALVNQINHGNFESNVNNNNRKKSVPQIKPSELPTTNPVSQLASMFEPKSVA